MKSCRVKLQKCCRDSFKVIIAARPVGMHNVRELWNSRQIFMNGAYLKTWESPNYPPTSSSTYILFEQFSLWLSFGALLIYSLASGSGSAGCKINVTSPKFWASSSAGSQWAFPPRGIFEFSSRVLTQMTWRQQHILGRCFAKLDQSEDEGNAVNM